MVYNLKTICLLACLTHCLLFKYGLQFKPLNTSVKQFIIINTLVFDKNRFRTLTFFFLLNFEHDSTIFSPFLLAYTFDVLDLISQHNQPNTICYLLCTIYYARFTMHYALYTMHYSLCTMHYALCIYTYSYVFTILYVFIRIYYFTWKSDEIP